MAGTLTSPKPGPLATGAGIETIIPANVVELTIATRLAARKDLIRIVLIISNFLKPKVVQQAADSAPKDVCRTKCVPPPIQWVSVIGLRNSVKKFGDDPAEIWSFGVFPAVFGVFLGTRYSLAEVSDAEGGVKNRNRLPNCGFDVLAPFSLHSHASAR